MYMIVFGLSLKLIQEMQAGIADGLVQNVSSDSQHVSKDERTCLNGGEEEGFLLVL